MAIRCSRHRHCAAAVRSLRAKASEAAAPPARGVVHDESALGSNRGPEEAPLARGVVHEAPALVPPARDFRGRLSWDSPYN